MTNLMKICITIIVIGGIFMLGFMHRALVENNVYTGGQSFVSHPNLPEAMSDGSSEAIIGGLDVPINRYMRAGTLEQVRREIYYNAVGRGWRIYNRIGGGTVELNANKNHALLDFITPTGVIVGYKLQNTGQGQVLVSKMQLDKAQINNPYQTASTVQKIPTVLRNIMIGSPVVYFRRSSGPSASMLLTTSCKEPPEACEANLRSLLKEQGWELQTMQNDAIKKRNMYRHGRFIIAEKNNIWCNIAISNREGNSFIAYRLNPTSVRKTFSMPGQSMQNADNF
ncbi:MAG: hypothetical protein GY750_00350 [Lentisphaerae bacterium]|nr:hypothetical protein [Lentisphaerota bacterium]MCP4099870.1 hypothetical protein [Lentisphaerota bacterium]